MKEYVVTLSPPQDGELVLYSMGLQQLLYTLRLEFKINYQDSNVSQFFVKTEDDLESFRQLLHAHGFNTHTSEREFEEEDQ